MVTASAAIISYVISYLRVPTLLIEYVAYLGLSRYLVLGLVCISYIIMGCFIEGICMVVITIPIVFPVMVALGFDPVWLGIILVILIEVGLITPPVGMNLFVIKGVDPESKFEEIFMGAMPFVAIMIVMIIVLTVFPELATWLPNLMAKRGGF